MSDGYRRVERFDPAVVDAMVRQTVPDCGGPDRCVNDMCRGYDEGICGRLSAEAEESADWIVADDDDPGLLSPEMSRFWSDYAKAKHR